MYMFELDEDELQGMKKVSVCQLALSRKLQITINSSSPVSRAQLYKNKLALHYSLQLTTNRQTKYSTAF